MERLRLKIGGGSGLGLLSVGEIVTDALREMGFHLIADRQYPSLIKGGHSCFVVNASSEPVYGLSEGVDIMMMMDLPSMEAYVDDLNEGGIFVHGYEREMGMVPILKKLEAKSAKVIHLMAREVAEEMGGNVLMQNVVTVGMLWKAMGLPFEYVRNGVEKRFLSKPKLLPINLKCVEAGYERTEALMSLKLPAVKHEQVIMNGNQAVAMGAVACGVRAYFAYPMSPASSILSYMALWAEKTGMIVKQAEDEITVANMTLGASFAGTRAMCGTSGGGFDLMAETVSLAGIIEGPFVCVLCQRPGPATGLPTWTGQGDLNIAIHSGHGEFARVVMACGDNEDAFYLTQHANNLAEEYQVPVVLLSEKQICEGISTVEKYKEDAVPIKRGLVMGEDLLGLKNDDRYKITESGLSKRWIPGSADAYYFANGDEHWENGELTEDGPQAREMYAKRVRKLDLIREALPEPEIFGVESGADISFVGWGSSKGVMRDVIKELEAAGGGGLRVNYLHFSYLWPLRLEKLQKFFEENKKICLIEGNYTGQFGNLIEEKLGKRFAARLLKWDGRVFTIEEVMRFVKENIN